MRDGERVAPRLVREDGAVGLHRVAGCRSGSRWRGRGEVNWPPIASTRGSVAATFSPDAIIGDRYQGRARETIDEWHSCESGGGTLTRYATQWGAANGMFCGFALNLPLWQW